MSGDRKIMFDNLAGFDLNYILYFRNVEEKDPAGKMNIFSSSLSPSVGCLPSLIFFHPKSF